MSFDPKEFIVIAEEIDKGTTEAHVRSMINRAYYGAFGYAKLKTNFTRDGASVHQDLIAYLKRLPDANAQMAGCKLETLFKNRKKADYQYNFCLSKSSYVFSIKYAEEVISLLDSSSL
ncbi:MAG: hypothetical protein Q8862_00545 [Bacteroidota bacterium]|nr:hypothetical protein [Bacteroidota bacterium]